MEKLNSDSLKGKNNCIFLDTFPEEDKYYCKSFSVPMAWVIELMDSVSHLANGEPFNLQTFLDNYIWEETDFIYNQAEKAGVLLGEKQVQ